MADTPAQRKQGWRAVAVIESFVRVIDFLTDSLIVVSGAVVALMALHIGCDVGGRYLAGSPLPGTVEIVSRYYMVVLAYLPLAELQRTEGHFVAGIFTDRLPQRARDILDGLASLCMAVVVIFIAWCSLRAANSAAAGNEQMQAAEFTILTWPSRYLVPLGFALMAIYAIRVAARKLSLQPNPRLN